MLKIDKNSTDPIYLQIYQQMKDQIIRGELKKGERLKATRVLSEEYHLSRNTVLSAYQQLESEGFVRSVIGSGFYVEDIPEFNVIQSERMMKESEGSAQKTVRYDFRYGSIEPNVYRSRAFRKALKDAMAQLEGPEILNNVDPQGLYSLRQAICEHLYEVRGVNSSPDQILITGGHHDSIALLCKAIPEKNRTLLMEDPGHEDSRRIFSDASFQIVPIPLDGSGILVEEILKYRDALAYVTPSHQFPTGTILPIARRLQLLKWAAECDSFIVEDDYDSELRYKEQPVPSLFSLDRNERVIYLGSFSKSLSPDLRISYIVFPSSVDMKALIGRYVVSSSSSQLIQLALSNYLRSGEYRKRISQIRNLLRKKHGKIVDFLHERYGRSVKISGIGGGTHFILELPTKLTQKEIIRSFRERDVAVYPTAGFWHERKNVRENTILIGYSGIPLDQLDEYLHHLGRCIDDIIEE